MRPTPQSLDTALIWLTLATVVCIGLADDDTGRRVAHGRSLLAMWLTSVVEVLGATLRVPVTLLRRLTGGRDARRWKAEKAVLLATLDWVVRSGGPRGERSSLQAPPLARPEVEPAARIEGSGLGEGPGFLRVAGSTGEAKDPGLAINARLAVPRDAGAEVGGLPRSNQLTALTMQVGLVPMARSPDHLEADAAGDMGGLGPLPARWGPRVPASVWPDPGLTGLTIDIAGCSDEGEIMTLTLGIAVTEPQVTGVEESIERPSCFSDAPVDPTEAG